MKKQKIYLSGPIAGRSVDQLNEFAIVSAKLEEAGFAVETPITALDGANDNSLSRQEMMRKRLATMMDCTSVIPLDDFEVDLDSIAEVKIARLIDMPVFPLPKFLLEYCKQAAHASV